MLAKSSWSHTRFMADFFPLRLLHTAPTLQAFGHVGRIIATTFETLDCLRERYKDGF